MAKVIKSDADYEAAVAEIGRLLDAEAAAGTPEADNLELLTLLVREYESSHFPVGVPDPIEAIRFRMEQQNLSQRDLVPFIGSRSKVSEVLSGRRPLTLSMIRALHSGLGIPAKVLLQGREATDLEESPIQWDRFPLREMVGRGWIEEKVEDYRSQTEDVLRGFFGQLGHAQPAVAFLRQSRHVRSARDMDVYALTAWTARVLILAARRPHVPYKTGTLGVEFMREVAHLSVLDQGPSLAGEFLEKYGIRLVIEPHLPGTFLDGAALWAPDGGPVIGLTIRYDRIDNFWFSLMHELAHVTRHLDPAQAPFYDDLDVGPEDDPREKEADSVAGEALITNEEWRKSPASRLRSPEATLQLANLLLVHPAIVAGRYRHEHKNYRVLNQIVGHGKVRCLFRDVKWS
ncbi:MAG: transcriptional regulator [Acidobacteria bacterium]|nr:transcriptional regulator [Acidobacteriota bacterium]